MSSKNNRRPCNDHHFRRKPWRTSRLRRPSGLPGGRPRRSRRPPARSDGGRCPRSGVLAAGFPVPRRHRPRRHRVRTRPRRRPPGIEHHPPVRGLHLLRQVDLRHPFPLFGCAVRVLERCPVRQEASYEETEADEGRNGQGRRSPVRVRRTETGWPTRLELVVGSLPRLDRKHPRHYREPPTPPRSLAGSVEEDIHSRKEERVLACTEQRRSVFLVFHSQMDGHLSWSWFWVLSPLWLLKPLGFLCNSWHEELRRKNDRCEQRLYVYIGEDLPNRTGSLVLTALVVLRLDDHITSWWWVVAVFLFYFIASVVFSSWWDTAWSRRLRRAKAERQERCNRELGGGTSDTGGA